MHVAAVVVAAGQSKRFQSKIPKSLVKIAHKPVIIYSLEVLSRHPLIKEIIVVGNSLSLKRISRQISRYRIKKIKAVVLGGLRRQDSVFKGLEAVSCQSDLVLVHDAARPFIDKRMISAAIKEADNVGAAIVGVPVKATIKKIASSLLVEKTIDRENLWEVQTPQVFRMQLLLKAYLKFGKPDVTDDAMLVEKAGAKVAMVMGSYDNIKITVPQDLMLAEAILKKKNNGIPHRHRLRYPSFS